MTHSWIAVIPLTLLLWKTWHALQLSLQREQELHRQLKLARIEGQGSPLPPNQLNPHFLFNSLNTIRYFVRTNGKAAREMLLDLSLVLQAALRRENKASLRDELESARAYLRLEHARLGDRLEIHDQIPDSEMKQLVPTQVFPQLLQALVNAVTSKSSGGTIRLFVENGELIIEGDERVELERELVAQLPPEIQIEISNKTRYTWRLIS